MDSTNEDQARPKAARRTTVAAAGQATVQVRRASLWLMWAIAAFFIALSVWAAVAEIETVTRADGRVVPSAKLQVIQNLEGGIVTEILAKQGALVKQGDRLVALSTVQHDAEQQVRFQQVLSLDARASRLAAQARGTDPEFSDRVLRHAPELVAVERAAFTARKAELEAQLAVMDTQIDQRQRELQEARITLEATRRSLELGREERATIAMLVQRGLEPRLELVRVDRGIAEMQARAEAAPVTIARVESAIGEIRSRKAAAQAQFRSEALAELNRTTVEMQSLQKSLPALADRVARADIRSPLRGVVNRVFVNTVGGVVKPGDPIVEIVPADDQLVVEALVLPRDIGFMKLGQLANVKITAYDYAVFGSMEGTVVGISADTVPNERGEAFFVVRIETRTPVIEAIDRKLPIIPGMQAQIDVVTGRRTVLQYFSKPLVGLKENAFRER